MRCLLRYLWDCYRYTRILKNNPIRMASGRNFILRSLVEHLLNSIQINEGSFSSIQCSFPIIISSSTLRASFWGTTGPCFSMQQQFSPSSVSQKLQLTFTDIKTANKTINISMAKRLQAKNIG